MSEPAEKTSGITVIDNRNSLGYCTECGELSALRPVGENNAKICITCGGENVIRTMANMLKPITDCKTDVIVFMEENLTLVMNTLTGRLEQHKPNAKVTIDPLTNDFVVDENQETIENEDT